MAPEPSTNAINVVCQSAANASHLQLGCLKVVTTSNSTAVYMTNPVKIMYAVCFALSGLAVAVSVVIIFVIIRHIAKRSSYVILVLNLCAADCIVALSTFGLSVLQYLRLESMDSSANDDQALTFQKNCYCSQFFFEETWKVAFYTALFVIMMMTIHHLVALRWPLWNGGFMTTHGVTVALLLSWTLALVLGFLHVFIILSSYHHRGDACADVARFCCQLHSYMSAAENHLNREFHKKAEHLVVVAVTILAFVVVVCVYAYLLTQSRNRWRIRSTAQRKIAATSPSERAWKRLMATTAMLVGAFCIFWMPHIAYANLYGLRLIPNLKFILGEEKLHVLKISLYSLVCLCSFVDPLIYGLRVPAVRSAMERTLGICCRKDLKSAYTRREIGGAC